MHIASLAQVDPPSFSHALAARVRREVFETISRSGLSSTLLLAIAALLATRLLYGRADDTELVSWCALVLLSLVARAAVFWRWTRARSQAHARTDFWERAIAACALFDGVVWGALSLVVSSADPLTVYLIATVDASVMVIGFSTFGLSRLLFPLFGLPIFIAQGVRFAIGTSAESTDVLSIWAVVGIVSYSVHRISVTRFRLAQAERMVQEEHASQQRVLLDTLKVGVAMTQGDVIQDCNEAFVEMFGYQRRDLIGKNTSILLPPSDNSSIQPARAENSGEGLTRVARMRRDGSVIQVEIERGFVNERDASAGTVGTYEDVTAQVRVERELRHSRERLRLALDALQSGVWEVDVEAGRHFLSTRFKSMLNLSNDAMPPGDHVRPFFHHGMIDPEDQAMVADLRMATLLFGEPFDAQYRIAREGEAVWLRETAVVLNDDAGVPNRFTGSITDTTAMNVIQERLRVSELFHRGLIEASSSLLWRTNAQGVLIFVNERGANDLYGYTSEELVGKPVSDLWATQSMTAEAVAQFNGVLHGRAVRNTEQVHLSKTGRKIFVSVNAVPVFDADGRYDGIMGNTTDITSIKRRERAFQDATRLQRLIFDGAGEGIVLVRHGRLHRVNQAFADLVGSTVGDLVARPLAPFFEDAAQWEQVEAQLAELGNVIKVEQQLLIPDRAALWVSVTGRVAERDGSEAMYIWVFADISARKEQEQQSWHRANHDELTGLPNRRMLYDRFEQSLSRARREDGRIAVFMLDLDGFKQINDQYGHQVGDEVLRQIAARLVRQIRQLDTVARLGGDEFVVLLHRVAHQHDLETAARRMVEQIGEPVIIEGQELSVSSSLGIAVFPDHADGIAGLMHAADVAMYAAKASGKNTFRIATPSRNDRALLGSKS